MDTAAKQSPTGTSDTNNSMEVAELRRRVREIGEELSAVVERRGQALKEGAQAGAASLRGTIRRQPVIAIGVAAMAGALIAAAVVPRPARSRTASRLEAWTPSISRADLYDVADNIQRSVARATSSVPSSLERLVDTLTHSQSSQSVNEVLQKVGGWFQKARSSVSS